MAIDEEMTGINLPGSKRPAKDDTPQDRYQANKTVPERYSIIQLGVALFHQHPDYTESSEGPEFQVVRTVPCTHMMNVHVHNTHIVGHHVVSLLYYTSTAPLQLLPLSSFLQRYNKRGHNEPIVGSLFERTQYEL